MENFGYIHQAASYEDPSPDQKLRSLKDLGLALPNSAWVGVASLTLAVSIMATAHDAMALVRRGDSGASVVAVQRALRDKGYSVGSLDGVFGSKTEYALTIFQRDRGLSADGIAGPATERALGISGSGGGGGAPTGTVTVTAGSGLIIRSGPGTGYGSVGSLGYGDRVTTYGSSNGWYKVSGGWISSYYTSTGGGSGSGGGGGVPSTVTVTAPIGVNIRSGPGTGYRVVGGLGYGAQVRTYDSYNGWYQVSGGWISSSYAQ